MNTINKEKLLKNIFRIGFPIMLQQLLIQGMRLLDSLMIGSLGEKEVIAVGNAGQVSFLMFIFLFGVGSAVAIYTAQYWGNGDQRGIKNSLSLGIALSFVIVLPFFIAGQFFAGFVMSFINPDPEIIRLSAGYLRIDSISYFFFALTQIYTSVLKGTRQTKIPLFTCFIAIIINAFLNWVFIFGNLGMPRLGVEGAALGTTTAIIFEFFMIYIISNRKQNPVRMRLKEINFGQKEFIRPFLKNSIPVMLNEILWAIGNFGFVLLFNRMGKTTAAAMAIFVVIERMGYSIYTGLGHSACILVGNKIGAHDEKGAYEYGRKFLWSGVLCAVVIGGIIYLLRGSIASVYNVSVKTREALDLILLSYALISWVSVFNYVNIVGVLRGGGDTRMAAVIDLSGMYLFSLPVAYILGLVVKLPVHIVYFCMIGAGDLVRMAAGILRIRSKKWIRNLVDQSERFEVQL